MESVNSLQSGDCRDNVHSHLFDPLTTTSKNKAFLCNFEEMLKSSWDNGVFSLQGFKYNMYKNMTTQYAIHLGVLFYKTHNLKGWKADMYMIHTNKLAYILYKIKVNSFHLIKTHIKQKELNIYWIYMMGQYKHKFLL